MGILSINYDLHQPGQNYDKLQKILQDLKLGGGRVLYSTWLVTDAMSPEDIYARMKPALDSNDNVLISKITRPYNGWLNQKWWDWIRENI